MKPFPDPAESMSAGSNSSPAQPFIVFRCPNCGKRIGFPPKMANTVAVCSACKARLMVPSKADEESFLVCDGPSAKPPVPQASRLVARHEPAARSEWPNRRSSVLVLAAACVALAGLAIPLSLASRGKPVAQRGDKGGKTVAPAASNPSATASSPHVPDTQAVAAPAPTAEPQKPPALRTVAVPAAPAGEPDAALRTAAVPAAPDMDHGYRLEVNSQGRTATILYRNGKEAARVAQDSSFPIQYTGGHAPYSPRRNHITLIKHGALLRAVINGKEVLRFTDPQPLDVGTAGIGGYKTRINFSHVEVRRIQVK
jgi:hypothetical protein